MTQLAGKKRSFGRGLGLAIVTLGFYQFYWWYKAYKEVYQQERRTDFPTGLFWVTVLVPLVNLVTIFIYASKVLGTLNAARQARGMPPTVGVGGWILWNLVPIAGVFIAYHKVQTAVNEYWDSEMRRHSITPMAPQTAPQTVHKAP